MGTISHYAVSSGKYDDNEVNWKYLNEFDSFEAAYNEWIINTNYPVNQLEVVLTSGKRLTITFNLSE